MYGRGAMSWTAATHGAPLVDVGGAAAVPTAKSGRGAALGVADAALSLGMGRCPRPVARGRMEHGGVGGRAGGGAKAGAGCRPLEGVITQPTAASSSVDMRVAARVGGKGSGGGRDYADPSGVGAGVAAQRQCHWLRGRRCRACSPLLSSLLPLLHEAEVPMIGCDRLTLVAVADNRHFDLFVRSGCRLVPT